MKLDFIDVRRAYFYAEVSRDIYIELPKEDYEFRNTFTPNNKEQ